jgi:hypothetical protein
MLMLSYLPLLILLPSFVLALSPRSSPYHVTFTYQYQASLSVWFDILTLCFTPLATHVAFGLGKVVVLNKGKTPGPRWIDRLTHFNPISIAWRYYAVVDRRVRAKNWSREEMILCNIALWDGGRDGRSKVGWDGRESVKSMYHTILPEGDDEAHVKLLSASAAKTVIITLQGVQAINNILERIWPNRITGGFSNGLGGLFVPLALLGLTRLPAAPWVSDDSESIRVEKTPLPSNDEDEDENECEKVLENYKETTTLVGTAYRVWWVLSMLVYMSFSWGAIFAGFTKQSGSSVSGLLERLMYLTLTGGGFFIHLTYIWKGYKEKETDIFIPCIGSMWYKIYTCVLILLAAVAFVVRCLENPNP